MKLTLLLCTLLLSAQAWCASTAPAAPMTALAASMTALATPTMAPAAYNYSAIGKKPFSQGRLKKPFRERQLYSKGKGTVGLILGITLGPIGYGAVHLFTHNQTQREKARTGMIVWIAVVATGAIVWGCIAAKVSLDDVWYFLAQAAIQSI